MTKKIYISHNTKREPTAVVAADSIREAYIALAHMKNEAATIEEVDMNDDKAIIFLLTSVETNSREFSHRPGGVDFRIWKRGI